MAEQVSLAFVGDIFLGEDPRIKLDAAVRAVWQDADLVIGNQEGPLTGLDQPTPGKCCLRSATSVALRLRKWGIQVVSLANNHVFDHGWEGFEETRRVLADAGIACLGAGENLSAATRPLVLDVPAGPIGLLAYSWKYVQTRCATESDYGCAPLDGPLMVRQVGELGAQVAAVIVLPHWGYCEYHLPTPEQRTMADELLAAGATAVVGTHSHVMQGVQHKDGRLVAFSLGNFAFAPFLDRGVPEQLTRENLEGVILKITLRAGQVASYEVVFTEVCDDTIVLRDTQRRRDQFTARQAALASQDYPARWRRYLRGRLVRRVLHHANILKWRRIKKETLIGAWILLKGVFGRR